MKEAKVGDRVRVLGLPVENAERGIRGYYEGHSKGTIGTVTSINTDSVPYAWIDDKLAYFLSDLKVVEEEKSSGRASITYKRLGSDRYQILDWKVDDPTKWSEEIRQLYFSQVPCFCIADNKLKVKTEMDKESRVYYKGIILCSSDFSSLISTLKSAGARLSQIKKDLKSAEVRTILI